ncbi:hypothetical protein BDR26DRAFT_1014154 [Obelidium mucronatum]|nr:hypothetical protein BDR26DRAFT_1014154 [Obelidium mucronatum]
MKIPASHVKMGAQLAEQFPAFQAEFSIYGSFEKTYNKTLRLREFIQLIATSFGFPILAKQTAEAVFDSRIHETITPNVVNKQFSIYHARKYQQKDRWQVLSAKADTSLSTASVCESTLYYMRHSVQLPLNSNACQVFGAPVALQEWSHKDRLLAGFQIDRVHAWALEYSVSQGKVHLQSHGLRERQGIKGRDDGCGVAGDKHHPQLEELLIGGAARMSAGAAGHALITEISLIADAASASTTAHQMLKRQKHMSEQGLSRTDVKELRVLDDRTKGQEFVYGLNTDTQTELRSLLQGAAAPHIRNLAALFQRLQLKVKTCGNMRVINLCSWTGVADGIKDLHYPADVASVKVKEHAKKVANGLAILWSLNSLALWSHWEAFEMAANITKEVATTCDPIFGIFTSSFLACSNNGDFKFHLDSKNSTFGINFSVVVDEEDAVPPVVWPVLYLPDRNVVIPVVHGEAIVSIFKHEKHGTRMWHSGERQFVVAAELAAEADTRKFVGSAVVEKRGVTSTLIAMPCDRYRDSQGLARIPNWLKGECSLCDILVIKLMKSTRAMGQWQSNLASRKETKPDQSALMLILCSWLASFAALETEWLAFTTLAMSCRAAALAGSLNAAFKDMVKIIGYRIDNCPTNTHDIIYTDRSLKTVNGSPSIAGAVFVREGISNGRQVNFKLEGNAHSTNPEHMAMNAALIGCGNGASTINIDNMAVIATYGRLKELNFSIHFRELNRKANIMSTAITCEIMRERRREGITQIPEVKHVKGHSGDIGNEQADKDANKGHLAPLLTQNMHAQSGVQFILKANGNRIEGAYRNNIKEVTKVAAHLEWIDQPKHKHIKEVQDLVDLGLTFTVIQCGHKTTSLFTSKKLSHYWKHLINAGGGTPKILDK